MSDMLTIGSSAVAAYQRALGTVSNNIANVGTEGYVRQETSMSENMPRQQGKIYLGTGVSVAGIKRAYDQFLEQNLRNSTSEMNTQGPMVDYGNRIVDIMGSDTVRYFEAWAMSEKKCARVKMLAGLLFPPQALKARGRNKGGNRILIGKVPLFLPFLPIAKGGLYGGDTVYRREPGKG